MITWDGVLASMQRRADLAALHLPGYPIAPTHSAPAGFGRTAAVMPAVAGTAAGDPNPTGVTGSHHNAATGEQS